jgi:SNF2 family DNA or RNA helicase
MLTHGAALLMDMGTMKTKTVIDTAEILHSAGLVNKVLVITILNIVDGWAGQNGQLEKHSSNSVWSEAIGSAPQRKRAIQDVNDAAGKNMGLCWCLINIQGVRVVYDDLVNANFDMVVIDESTIIKTRTASQTKEVISGFKKAPFKIIMTGNPIPKAADEAFAQYLFIDEGVFGKRYSSFIDKYCDVDYFRKVTGLKDAASFDEELYSIAFRVKQEECLSLPPKMYQITYVNMTKEQEKIYGEMYEDAVSSFDDLQCSAPFVITKFLRCSQIAGGFFPGNEMEVLEDDEEGKIVQLGAHRVKALDPNPKMEALVDVVNRLREQGEKIVIWARFRAEIEMIHERMLKEKHAPVLYYGGVKYKDKTAAKHAFNTGLANIFIGNAASAGKGLNELAGASYVIYYSNSYSSEDRQQSEQRTTRPGMDESRSCMYIDLVCRGTIDEDCLEVLQGDKDFADAILSRRLDKIHASLP